MLLSTKLTCLLLLLVNNVFAVPQSPSFSTSDSDDHPSSSSSPRTTPTLSSTPSASSISSNTHRVQPHPVTSPHKVSGIFHSRTFTPPRASPTSVAQRPRPWPRPTGADPPTHVPHRDGDRPSNSAQKPIAIVFEVLAGLVGLAILLTLARCVFNYSRTPKRDRIADILSRHQLQRELEELERNPIAFRRGSIHDPAPPYFPPPPAYTHPLPQPAALAPERPADYTQLPTSSPPSSPPFPVNPLPSSPIHLSASTDSDTIRSSPPASSSESYSIDASTLLSVSPPSTSTPIGPQLSQPSG